MTAFLAAATLILVLRGAPGPVVIPMPDMRTCVTAARNFLPVYSQSRLFVEASCIEHATGGVVVVKPDMLVMP